MTEHICGKELNADDIADNWCPQCGEYLNLALAKRTEPRFRGELWIDGHIEPKPVNPELVELGEKAAARLKANEDKDLDKWAGSLADDLSKLKD